MNNIYLYLACYQNLYFISYQFYQISEIASRRTRTQKNVNMIIRLIKIKRFVTLHEIKTLIKKNLHFQLLYRLYLYTPSTAIVNCDLILKLEPNRLLLFLYKLGII